jgi:hypothetical protein
MHRKNTVPKEITFYALVYSGPLNAIAMRVQVGLTFIRPDIGPTHPLPSPVGFASPNHTIKNSKPQDATRTSQWSFTRQQRFLVLVWTDSYPLSIHCFARFRLACSQQKPTSSTCKLWSSWFGEATVAPSRSVLKLKRVCNSASASETQRKGVQVLPPCSSLHSPKSGSRTLPLWVTYARSVTGVSLGP